jgi:hypothetical protein
LSTSALHAACDTFVRNSLEAPLTSSASGVEATNFPQAVLVEVKPFPVPISYASAFAKPVEYKSEGVLETSLCAMLYHADIVNARYNINIQRRVLYAPGYSDIDGRGGLMVDDIDQLIMCLVKEACHG